MYNSPQRQDFPEGLQSSSNVWWNMFMAADKESAASMAAGNEPIHKLAPIEPTESASSARSSLLFPESMRASSSSSSGDLEEEQDDVDSENASTTTDTSSTAAQRRRDPQNKRLGGSRGGTITALSGATLLLEAETDGEDGDGAVAEGSEPSDKHGTRHTATSVWNITPEQRRYYLREFSKLQPSLIGLIPGLLAKQYFVRSELPNQVLAEIWAMSDLDADGALNITEFCCAMHLVVAVRNGVNLPSLLPAELLQSAVQIAERVSADPAYLGANRSSAKKTAGEKSSDATLRPVPALPPTNDTEGVLIPIAGSGAGAEPWPNATTESIGDGTQQSLAFPSNVPSRASSMASNLASFDDRPPASALYPFAVRPAPALPAQIPPPPPPRRPPQQQQVSVPPSSPPMPTNPATTSLVVNSLLTSQAVSASASSLQPLLPVNDSASITSATSDSSQLQLLVPPLEQLRTRNQQLALRYRELLTELERIRLERTTLQTRLKQFRMTGTNGSHRHDIPTIGSNVIGGEINNN